MCLVHKKLSFKVTWKLKNIHLLTSFISQNDALFGLRKFSLGSLRKGPLGVPLSQLLQHFEALEMKTKKNAVFISSRLQFLPSDQLWFDLPEHPLQRLCWFMIPLWKGEHFYKQ